MQSGVSSLIRKVLYTALLEKTVLAKLHSFVLFVVYKNQHLAIIHSMEEKTQTGILLSPEEEWELL